MKKLTAGIFTVMLGLCATSGADAAVASQGYVDTKVGVNTQLITDLTGEVTDLQTQVGEGTVDSRIETAKQAAIDAAAADATTKANKALEDAKADAEKYIDATELATAQSEQNTAIETAYKAADKKITDSIGTVPADKTVVGMIAEAQTAATYDDTEVRGLVSANTNAISAINNEQTGILALAKADATSKANAAQSAAEATAASALSEYKSTNDAAVEAAKNAADAAKATADGAVSVNESQATAISANTNAISAINNTETGILAVAKKYADDNDADTIYDDTEVRGLITANTNAIETLNGGEDVTGSVAKSIADAFTEANLSQYAIKSEVDGALLLYTKTSELGKLAMKNTVGTNDIDNLAVTTGKLANGAVTNDKISDVASSKVTGLSESLATKMDITSTTTQAGKYVFTANVGENGVTDYAWEEIARD